MSLNFKKWERIVSFQIAALCLILLVPGGCDTRRELFTIGIVAWDTSPCKRQVLGFKVAMAELNSAKNRTIEYFNETIPEDSLYDVQQIDSKLKMVLAHDPDLLLSVGQEVTVQAKMLVEGTDLPVLFSGTAWPVESGFVESIGKPGGNLTGVRLVNCIPKALELLAAIDGVKNVYLPYNPNDTVSVISLEGLKEIADHLGLELVPHKIYSVEEAANAIESLPGNIDAVYRIPSPTLDPYNSELSRAAIKRRIPMVAPIFLDEAVLMTLGNDEYNIGEKLGRLAQQIMQGAKPADLPVETAEIFLTVNLDTAEKIGLNLPDEILAQSKKIIR